MPLPANFDRNRRYTFADYLTWGDDVRVELIDGFVYDMTPAPHWRHQEILLALSLRIGLALEGKPCRLFMAPLDVRFPKKSTRPDDGVETVVQPDLLITCDSSRLDDRGHRGAPTLVVEILSPSTSGKDQVTKLNLYQQNGVREYWIVDPDGRHVLVFVLNSSGIYGKPTYYSPPEVLAATAVPDLRVDLSKVFGPEPTREPPASHGVGEPAADLASNRPSRRRRSARAKTSGRQKAAPR